MGKSIDGMVFNVSSQIDKIIIYLKTYQILFSGDPLSNMQVNFNSKEEAVEHCEKNGWKWFVDSEENPKPKRVKNYGVNFSWNRRTRTSTK